MKNRFITTAQQIFVDAVLNGDTQKQAAIKAGYSSEMGSSIMSSMVVNKKLCGHARTILSGKIDLQGAPAGYRVLMLLLNDENTGRTLRVDIAKFLINHSVPMPKAYDLNLIVDKQPHEMSDAELHDLITKTDDAMTQRGLLIEATPVQDIDSVI